MASEYDEILELPHHRSSRHPPLSMESRAAQFSPFAALTGFDSAIAETARETTERAELEEDRVRELDEVLSQIWELLPERPGVRLTYFLPDRKKYGGEYRTISGRVSRMDIQAGWLELEDDIRIEVQQLYALELQNGEF